MEKVDKGINELHIFNENATRTAAGTAPSANPESTNERGTTSVNQLKELLKNYEGIVESQHHLLETSITKMSAIPPPDELAATFERFQIVKDEELDSMRSFLNEHKAIMQSQYNDFEMEKRQFEEMNVRMEEEKRKVALEREKIEHEIRSIRALNDDLYK